MVPGRPLERLDLERHAVDRDHPHRLAGGDRRRPVRAGPPLGARRRSPRRRDRRRRRPRRARRSSTPARSSAWRSGSAPSTACPSTNATTSPPTPAMSVIHDGRSVVPGSGSNSHTLPMTVQRPRRRRSRAAGCPPGRRRRTRASTATRTATAHARAGSVARPVHARIRRAGADDAGDADAGGEELEDQQGHADEQQQVGDRRAGDRVEHLVDERELRQYDRDDGLALHGAVVEHPLLGRAQRRRRPRCSRRGRGPCS